MPPSPIVPSLSADVGEAMPEPTNLALARIAKLLEQAKSEADGIPGSDGMLGYLIDLAILEARERQNAG